MKKSAIKTISILAILLLSLASSTLLLGIKFAKGENLSLQWGHLQVKNGNTNETEKTIAEDVCDYIFDLFENEYQGSWATVNAYWQYTDTDGIEACMGWQNDPENDVDFVTNWWVGDFFPSMGDPDPVGHFWFYGDADNVSDTFIDEWTTKNGTISSKQKFDFIWTCANGGTYWTDPPEWDNVTGIIYGATEILDPPPDNTNDKYGFFDGNAAVGMPLAWTNTTDMNLDGYNSNSGSYTYIGFEGNSPFMGDYLPETSVRTDNFPEAFYEYALGYHTPYYLHMDIDDSLDYASWDTYGDTFEDTDLYNGYWRFAFGYYFFCRMRVFGNGDMELPYGWE